MMPGCATTTRSRILFGVIALALITALGACAFMAQMFGGAPVDTVDPRTIRPQQGCRWPLTGLLARDSITRTTGRWVVPWPAINAHLQTLEIEEDSGEKNHVLQPVGKQGRVEADIAPIKGTEWLAEAAALEAARCGRVIARIISEGDHDPTLIRRDTNYLVIAMQNMMLPSRHWVFVIINPGRDYREWLPKFKYTPHYGSYGTPVFVGYGDTIRSSFRARPLSAKAKGCRKAGWKACFIDPGPMTFQGDGDGDGAYTILGSGESEPWVPCPLYGCCCGGDECHSDEENYELVEDGSHSHRVGVGPAALFGRSAVPPLPYVHPKPVLRLHRVRRFPGE